MLDRPHESVLMCLLQRSLGSRQGSWPTLEGRLRAAGSEEYPFGFTTRSLTDKQFSPSLKTSSGEKRRSRKNRQRD